MLEGGSAASKACLQSATLFPPQTTSRLASLANSFNSPRRFFSFFPQCGSLSLATSYISLNTPAFMHAYECTFALGGISIPCSLFTSHFSLAFKCEPSVTRVSNCLSVLVVITNFKAVIYITRGSTVSFNLNRKKNLNNRKTRVSECFFSLRPNFVVNYLVSAH